jgi:hypothetical protein
MENAVGASIGTPEHLIAVAPQGRLPKEVLVRFLAIEWVRLFADPPSRVEAWRS